MHIPAQRAVALAYKALLGLHGQAVAAGNDADTQVPPSCHHAFCLKLDCAGIEQHSANVGRTLP